MLYFQRSAFSFSQDIRDKKTLSKMSSDAISWQTFEDLIMLSTFALKVHKREIFYGSDFEIFTFS